MNRKQSSTLAFKNNSRKILCVLLCLSIFGISKAKPSRDSIPEERKHLLEILNDTTENGTLDKKNLNDGGSRVIFRQELKKSDTGIRTLAPRDSALIIRCPCKSDLKKTPLTYIDGVKATSGELNKLLPERIKSFSILKDSKAIELYGEEGKNGVIIITTKPVE